MSTHPSKEIIGSKGSELRGKRIVLCITGSVAVVECPDIARSLMRHGAEVYPVMSSSSQRLIDPNIMEWATGNPVVTKLSGKIEHVALAGNHAWKADLILVAPATANTIGKIACGIDDTTVTSVVSTAFGSQIPIMIVPAMHESMYAHPILNESIKKLKSLGVEFAEPRIEEEKAKIAKTQEIVDTIIRKLASSQDLFGLRMLITAGPTMEPIDPVRVVTNRSSGKMGVALAEEAISRGAEVTLIYGPGSAAPPQRARTIPVETTDQMCDAVTSELKATKCDVLIAAAAPGDWQVREIHRRKISTHSAKELNLKLKPTRKIIDTVKKTSPKTFLVAFKAEYRLPLQQLIDRAHARLLEAKADLIVVNDLGKKGAEFGSETNEVHIIDKDKNETHIPMSTKREVAGHILDAVHEKVRRKQACNTSHIGT